MISKHIDHNYRWFYWFVCFFPFFPFFSIKKQTIVTMHRRQATKRKRTFFGGKSEAKKKLTKNVDAFWLFTLCVVFYADHCNRKVLENVSRRLKLHLSVYRKRRLAVIMTVDKCLLFRWVTAYFMFLTDRWNNRNMKTNARMHKHTRTHAQNIPTRTPKRIEQKEDRMK